MTKRTFDEMRVVATGAQGFAQRFGDERRSNLDLPPTSQWRCNLAGLSQVHNLYFVAYGQYIYVYVPQFPSQKIGEQPSLTFTSQPSDRGLTGYIDQRNPHTINNLIVKLFGTEEVIAVVRDDGDVDAFLTRHIVHAIERRGEPGSTIGIDGDEIRPFFQSNVGISAWGLDIHSEARILATSSNAHEVRVFKFGLLQEDDLESPSDGDPDQSTVVENDSSGARKQHRKTDVTHHVLNGQTNIPYISFCNTGDDPEARWLLTTDISGVCRVMDLHSLEAVQAFRFGRSFATAHSGGFDRLNAGWAIMFLDRRSFRSEQDATSALGTEENVAKVVPKTHRNGEIWDLSNTVRRLEEYGEPFMPHQPPRSSPRTGRHSAIPSEATNDALLGSSSELRLDSDVGDDFHSADSNDDGNAGVHLGIAPLAEAEDNDSGGIEVEINDTNTQDDQDDDMNYQTAEDGEDSEDEDDDSMAESEHDSDSESVHRIGAMHMLIDDDDDPEDEGTEDTISYTSFYSGESVVGNDVRFVHPMNELCDGLPCPILHASVRNVYLLQPQNKHQSTSDNDSNNSAARYQPPMVGFANPLKQPIHQSFGYLRIFERLNMNASIPSLGIVILASQKGRALVLSLTKITRSTRIAPSLKDFECNDKSVYTMKVEAILPFAEQERQNQRSSYPLHGLAVSPLQGSQGKNKERWRLMMMYQDHSILSYEMSRKTGARDSAVDIGTVVI